MAELHARTHQRQKTQEWVDQRSARVQAEYQRVTELRQSTQTQGETSGSQPESGDFETWEEVVGGRVKGRVYGIGSVAQAAASSQSSYSVDSASTTLEAVLKREFSTALQSILGMQKKLEEKLEAQSAQIESQGTQIATMREQLNKQKEVVEADSDPERNAQLEESTESD